MEHTYSYPTGDEYLTLRSYFLNNDETGGELDGWLQWRRIEGTDHLDMILGNNWRTFLWFSTNSVAYLYPELWVDGPVRLIHGATMTVEGYLTTWSSANASGFFGSGEGITNLNGTNIQSATINPTTKLSSGGCASGQSVRYNSAGGSWECYTPGTGNMVTLDAGRAWRRPGCDGCADQQHVERVHRRQLAFQLREAAGARALSLIAKGGWRGLTGSGGGDMYRKARQNLFIGSSPFLRDSLWHALILDPWCRSRPISTGFSCVSALPS